MSGQRDYGSSSDQERPLVPGALRVFRHFMVYLDTGLITPMSHSPGVRSTGPQPYRPLFDLDGPATRTHEAECSRSPYSSGPTTLPPEGHEAPHKDCTCGFYAHYKRADDFYPYGHWGVGYSGTNDRVMVRAVCEVSGRVVLGGLGVRAQKMEIKAIAVDWSKYQGAKREIFEWSTTSWEDTYIRQEFDRKPSDELYNAVSDKVAGIATFYGADFHESWEEMYELFEEADVSALGVTYGPSKASDTMYSSQSLAYYQQMRRNQQIAADAWRKAATDITAAVKDAANALKGVTPDLVILDEIETTKERALRLKQQRPAPPGSGIDRRRGRLR